MNWFEWTLVGILAFSTFCTIGMVGKPRNPIGPGTAVFSLVVNGLIIAGLVAYR